MSLLDCPLSGTGEQARRGDVVAFLSGDDAAKARAAGVVEAMTRKVYDAGGSRMFQVRGPLMVAGDYSKPSVRVEVFQKDIDIIAAFARALHSPTPLFSLTSVFYQAALAQGRAGSDSACVMAVLEQLAGGPDGAAGRDGD